MNAKVTGMRTGSLLLKATVFTLVSLSNVTAAPLPPFEPLDLCGTIRTAKWLPPMTIAAVPGMSGSAGRDRSWPGRYVVILGEVEANNLPAIERINALLGSSADGQGLQPSAGEVILVLPVKEGQSLAMTDAICVTGFRIGGDEGGTWTYFNSLEVRPKTSE